MSAFRDDTFPQGGSRRACGAMPSIRRFIGFGSALTVLVTALTLGAVGPAPVVGASGTSWSIVPSPNVSLAQSNELRGVSCSSPSACIAVGIYTTSDSTQRTLVESWDGSVWSIVSSPNTSPTDNDTLLGVSCTGPSACFAVGSSNPGRLPDRTLIESWDGSVWSIVPSPNVASAQTNFLNGVSCSGPSACTAVGTYTTSDSTQRTLVESWDGSVWSIIPSPNTSPTDNDVLLGVSCSSPSACTAVGTDTTSDSTTRTLIESWNGSAWSILASPNVPAASSNLLSGVSCSGPSACFAVGDYAIDASTRKTLIESWNGLVWSILASPDTSPTHLDFLSGVSCSGPLACFAVGFSSAGAVQRTVIESWDGSVWSIVPSPNASPMLDNLEGVSCSGPTACTAVGASGGNHTTLVEHLTPFPALPGNIFVTTFKRCNTLHVGYNRFNDGTVVRWTVSTNGVGRVAEGQFTAIGGGKLGSKTYHFLNIPLGTTLPNEASGIQSHMHFYWANGGRYVATRDSGC